MHASRLVPVVALLVVLSGCAHLSASPTPEGTPSPEGTPTSDGTPTPTTPTIDGTFEPLPDETAYTSGGDVSFPNGTGEDGITDAEALVETNTRTLHATSFRYRFTRQSNRSVGGKPAVDMTNHVGTRDETEVHHVVKLGTWPGWEPQEVYVEGSTTFHRYFDANASDGYRFGVHRSDGDANPRLGLADPAWPLLLILSAGEWRYAGSATHDGTALLRFESTGSNARGFLDFEGTLVVTEAGTIRSLSARYVREVRDGPPVERTVTYRAETGVGPPAKPDWVDDVSRFSLSATSTDGVFALRQEGGDAIPAGTNLTAMVAGGGIRTEHRNISLPTRLAPGDAVFLYVVDTGAGYELRAAAEPPDPSTAVSLSRGDVVVDSVGDVRTWLVVHVGNRST